MWLTPKCFNYCDLKNGVFILTDCRCDYIHLSDSNFTFSISGSVCLSLSLYMHCRGVRRQSPPEGNIAAAVSPASPPRTILVKAL